MDTLKHFGINKPFIRRDTKSYNRNIDDSHKEREGIRECNSCGMPLNNYEIKHFHGKCSDCAQK